MNTTQQKQSPIEAFKHARTNLHVVERELSHRRLTTAQRFGVCDEFIRAADAAQVKVSNGQLAAMARIAGLPKGASLQQIKARIARKPSRLTAKDIDRARARQAMARLRARPAAEIDRNVRRIHAAAGEYVVNPADDTQISWLTCASCSWIYPEPVDHPTCPLCGAATVGEKYWGAPPDEDYFSDFEQAKKNRDGEQRPALPGPGDAPLPEDVPAARARRASTSKRRTGAIACMGCGRDISYGDFGRGQGKCSSCVQKDVAAMGQPAVRRIV